MKKTYVEMHIIPDKDKDDVIYGGFEGIVVHSTSQGFDFIEIDKMIYRENENGEKSYFLDSSMTIPYTETLIHSHTSGKSEARFLYSKAKGFAKNDEKIAICMSLVQHLMLLDHYWEKSQKKFREHISGNVQK